MDTATIAAITGLLQVAGTIVIIKIQQGQIKGLRDSVKDQKDSIDALKGQAEGQASLTNQQKALTTQMQDLMSKVLADVDKRGTLIKEIGDLETASVQKKLEQKQAENEELKKSQLNQLKELDTNGASAELKKLLSSVVEENASTKNQVAALGSQLSVFFSKTNSLYDKLIEANQNALIQSTQLFLPNSQHDTSSLQHFTINSGTRFFTYAISDDGYRSDDGDKLWEEYSAYGFVKTTMREWSSEKINTWQEREKLLSVVREKFPNMGILGARHLINMAGDHLLGLTHIPRPPTA